MEDPRRRLQELVRPVYAASQDRVKNALTSALDSSAAHSLAGLFRTGIGNEENPFLLPGIRVSQDEQGQSINEPMTMQETRRGVFERQGILPEIRQGYTPRLSEHFYEGIHPFGYGNKNVMRPVFNYFTGKDPKESRVWRANENMSRRSDAWKLYLGMPQENNTFRVSEHIPAESKNPDALYLSFHPQDEEKLIESLGSYENVVQHLKEQNNQKMTALDALGVMNNYTLGLGRDESGHYISYYDVWNLNKAPGADTIAQPFEIYGRVYYDPQTFRRIR